jgi:hypothetical protein
MTAEHAVAAWHDRLAALPTGHWRRYALIAAQIGATSVLVSAFFKPPFATVGLAVALAGLLASGAPLRRMPAFWIGVAYAAWISASGLIGVLAGVDGARLRPAGPAWTWLAMPAVALAFARPADFVRLLRVVAVVVAGCAMLAVLQFLIGLGGGPLRIDPEGVRLTIARGWSELHLTFGLLCALLLAVGLHQDAARSVGPAWIWLLRLGAGIGLLVCGARSAVLAALAGIGASFAVRSRRHLLIGALAVAALGGVLIARMALTDPGRLQRTMQLQDGRWPIWRTSVHLIKERPISGWGGQTAFQRAFRDAYATVNPGSTPEFADGAPHAHNSGLALVSQFGAPALVLHSALWLAVLLWLWRRRHEHPAAWQVGVAVAATAFVGGLFESYTTRVMQGVAMHAALGAAIALALQRRSPDAQPASG